VAWIIAKVGLFSTYYFAKSLTFALLSDDIIQAIAVSKS
jgi:hypothetical protein